MEAVWAVVLIALGIVAAGLLLYGVFLLLIAGLFNRVLRRFDQTADDWTRLRLK